MHTTPLQIARVFEENSGLIKIADKYEEIADPFKVAVDIVVAEHHVEEDGENDLAQFCHRNQTDFEEGLDEAGHKVNPLPIYTTHCNTSRSLVQGVLNTQNWPFQFEHE